MSVISEGKLTHSGTWKTSRSKFGTMITDPVGHTDMAYRVGNISYMPESMLPSIVSVPTPLKAQAAAPAQGEANDHCMAIGPAGEAVSAAREAPTTKTAARSVTWAGQLEVEVPPGGTREFQAQGEPGGRYNQLEPHAHTP